MAESQLDQKLDNLMSKYVAHIDHNFDLVNKQSLTDGMNKRFEQVDKRFAQIDIRYNWIIGLVITATIGIIGTVIKFH